MNILSSILNIILDDNGDDSKETFSAIPSGRMTETDDLEDIPHEPGIYRHMDKENNEIDYVGYSNNLNRRQHEHVRDGKYDSFTQKVAYSVSKEVVAAKVESNN